MAYRLSDIRRIYREDVPEQFIKDTLQLILDRSKIAFDYCQQTFADSEARDIFSTFRRSHLEGPWRQLANGYPGARGAVGTNQNGSANHTKCHFGRVVLTESSVDSVGEFPRWAEFRATYARPAQIDMFEKTIEPTGTEPLYAIVVYGPRKGYQERPAFFGVGFPTNDCKEYADFIDYSSMLAVSTPDEAVEEIRDQQPALRPNKKIKEED